MKCQRARTSLAAKIHLHGDVLAWREQGVVRVRTSDDRGEHDGLVGLVLEVPVPEVVKFGAHLLELLLGRTDLPSSIDEVRRESRFLRARLPLSIKLLLYLLDTAKEVIRRDTFVRDTED